MGKWNTNRAIAGFPAIYREAVRRAPSAHLPCPYSWLGDAGNWPAARQIANDFNLFKACVRENGEGGLRQAIEQNDFRTRIRRGIDCWVVEVSSKPAKGSVIREVLLNCVEDLVENR